MSGRPPKEKSFANMLNIAIKEANEQGTTKLREVADALVQKAISGDVQAIKEVADRLDGKPAQESTVTIDDKRESTDWTRAELVAFLNDARAGRDGTAAARGRDGEPDSVH